MNLKPKKSVKSIKSIETSTTDTSVGLILKSEGIAIIADIHHKINKAQTIISILEKDQNIQNVILLGDYFDDFNDTPEKAKETAAWLKESLSFPKRIHLFGNHDLAYFYPYHPHLKCPGWTMEKQKQINNIISPEDIEKFKSYVLIEPEEINTGTGGPHPITLVTHAGITIPSLYGINNPKETLEDQRLSFLKEFSPQEHIKNFIEESKTWSQALKKGTFHPFMRQGSRVGETCHGGPQWLDWSELEPIKGINQIVGHSIVKSPEIKKTNDSLNYCLDTNLNHFFILNKNHNKELEAFTTGDRIDTNHYKVFWQEVTDAKYKSNATATWSPRKIKKDFKRLLPTEKQTPII
jgi:hypothetical protein